MNTGFLAYKFYPMEINAHYQPKALKVGSLKYRESSISKSEICNPQSNKGVFYNE